MFIYEQFPSEMYDSTGIKRLEEAAMTMFELNSERLMQRAAVGALTLSQAFYEDAESVAIVCGKGNNAGDGLVLAQLYLELDVDVTIYHLTAIDDMGDLAKSQLGACENLGIAIYPWQDDIDFDEYDLIVDAILGTGIEGPAREPFKTAIDMINEAETPVLALDVPSGVNVDTGEVAGNAVIANQTITFLAFKQGLFTGAALDYVGTIYLDDLDVPNEAFDSVEPDAYRLSRFDIESELPSRWPSSHKGNFGHVLILGGDYGMPGAAMIAAQGAYRAGAGLVTVATRPEHVSAVVSSRPEVMCHGVSSGDDLSALFKRASVVVIGPGLGNSAWSAWLWQQAIAQDKPLIIDAGALDYLAQQNERRDNWILTPHPGEASRLLGCSVEDIQSNRFGSVAAIQEKFGGVAILKGAGTLIKTDGAIPEVCPYGNPGMACGGMGDLLCGLIASFCAQNLDEEIAARVGVIIHSLSADLAAENGQRGMLALDLLPYIREAVNPAEDDEDEDEIEIDEDDLAEYLELEDEK